MNKNIYIFYPTAKKLTGQQLATEQIISFLKKKTKIRLHICNIAVFDREKQALLYFIGYFLATIQQWLQMMGLLIIPKSTVYLNLGQSWIAILRDGLLFALLLHLRHNHKAIISLHGDWFAEWEYNSKIMRTMRFILNSADIVTVLGEKQKKSLSSKGIMLDKLRVVPNTTEITPLCRQDISNKHSEPKEVKLLYLSNLIASKGYKEFIETVKQLANEPSLNSKISACLCGEFLGCGYSDSEPVEELRNWINAEIKEINSSPNVTLKHIDGAYGKDKEKLFKQSHIFVFPSRIEAQPIVILEAMATGNVVISSMAGEIPSSLPKGTGFSLANPVAPILKNYILELVNNTEKRGKMALAALAYWEESFSYEKYCKNWENILFEDF